MGLKLVAGNPVNGVTAVYGPEAIDTTELINKMRDESGVQMAGGQAHLKGKIFRIGHMGYVSGEDMLVAIGTLEKTLREMGYECPVGAGLQAALEILA